MCVDELPATSSSPSSSAPVGQLNYYKPIGETTEERDDALSPRESEVTGADTNCPHTLCHILNPCPKSHIIIAQTVLISRKMVFWVIFAARCYAYSWLCLSVCRLRV